MAVFVDYKLFATEISANQQKKAIYSMLFWAIITLLTIAFLYVSYDNDWFGGVQSLDTTLGSWQAVSLFVSGFLLEQSLSLDNIFIIAFLLKYFRVPQKGQNRLR